MIHSKGSRTLGARKRREDYYAEPFPEDFGERLERFIGLSGLSWEEFADGLSIDVDRVMEWCQGAVPTGGEVWHIMRLAWPVPPGIEAMLPTSAGGRSSGMALPGSGSSGESGFAPKPQLEPYS